MPKLSEVAGGSAKPMKLSQVVGQQAPTVRSRLEPQASAAPAEPKGSLFGIGSDFYEKTGTSRLSPRIAWAALKDTFGSEEGAAKYIAEQVGGTVAQDADGSPLVTLKDGTSYRVNDKGIDSTDVGKLASNIGAFLIPASWAARLNQAKSVGLAGRVATQGATAGATDTALQLGFDGGNFNPVRTALASAGGAGGEALGAGISALARLRKAASPSAQQAASNMTREPSKASKLAKEVDAGANPAALLGQERYGLTYTMGQKILDPKRQFEQLSREELLRQNPAAGAMFRDQAANNVRALDQSLGDMGAKLGGRAGATPAELAQGAASRVQGQAGALEDQIRSAYQTAGHGGRTAVSIDAVTELPNRLRTAVAEFGVNAQLHPAASRTIAQISQATDHAARGGVKGVTLKAIETQRRIINNNIGAAQNPADRAATMAIKREFDGWLDDAVENSLMSGDPAALTALKDARQLRAEYGRRFEGKEQADKFIAGLLEGSKTPEELVNIALGASQVSKAGGARFIERLRAASGNDPGVIGNLRAAHFLRMTRGANGEPLNMGDIVRNIKSTEYNNASVVKALYSPQEWAEVKRLAEALDPLVAKGDFARSSGTAERLARMLFQRVGNVPVIGWGTKFVGDTVAQFRADRALNAPLKLPGKPSSGVATAGAAASQELAN